MLAQGIVLRTLAVIAIISFCGFTAFQLFLETNNMGANIVVHDVNSSLTNNKSLSDLLLVDTTDGQQEQPPGEKQQGKASVAQAELEDARWRDDCPVRPLTTEQRRILRDTAFVAFLCGGNNNPTETYGLAARLVINEVKCQLGADVNFVVLVTADVGHAMRDALRRDGARLVDVVPDTLTPPALKGHLGRYDDQFGKLAIFNMTEYKQIIFLDSDLIVSRDITPLLTALPADIDFGAVEDFGIVYLFEYALRYFNGGMFIARPSTDRFNHILSVLNLRFNAGKFSLAEQDWLNWYFGASFYKLPWIFNMQFLNCGRQDYYPGVHFDEALLYHFKGWDAKENCYTEDYPENAEKLTKIFWGGVERFGLLG